jgi:predicted nucleic acid-binding Zn ribbon protein
VAAKKRPEPIGQVLADVLRERGLSERVEQARVVDEWPALVGAQIAGVTEPLSVTSDGVLFVAVRTHAWMTELSLLEPELVERLNRSGTTPVRVRKIRWVLQR